VTGKVTGLVGDGEKAKGVGGSQGGETLLRAAGRKRDKMEAIRGCTAKQPLREPRAI